MTQLWWVGAMREGDVVREQGMSHQGRASADNSWINSWQRQQVCSGEHPKPSGSQKLETEILTGRAKESCESLAWAFPAWQLSQGSG